MHPHVVSDRTPRCLRQWTWVLGGGLMLLALSCGLSESGPGSARQTADDPSTFTAALHQGVPLQSRFMGAERVVLATVERVSAAFGRNEHGDELIISTVTLQVHESLRGEATTIATFELEGGTVGDLTLEVSDLPAIAPGDRGVFALRRGLSGGWVPNRRGLGILRVSPDEDLEPVRRAVRVSR